MPRISTKRLTIWIFVMIVIVLFTIAHVLALPENQMEPLGVSCTNHSGRDYNDLTVRLVDPDGLQVTPSQRDLGPIKHGLWGAGTFYIYAPPNSASPDPDHVLTFECVWNQKISTPVKVHVIVEPSAQAPWSGGIGGFPEEGMTAYAVAKGTNTGIPVYCKNTGSVTLDRVFVRVIDDAGLQITSGTSSADLGELAPGQYVTASIVVVASYDMPEGHHVMTFACEGTTPDGHGISSAVKVDVIVDPAGSFCQGGFCFKCFIATATYGSESAPEVQFLRGFRDFYVLNTFSGRSFVVMFNSFYYSFSPQVASVIASNMLLREFMQILLRPLLVVLGLAYYASFGVYRVDAEAGVMLTGLIACSLLGLVYFSPVVALLAWRNRTYRRFLASPSLTRVLVLIFLCSAGSVILASAIRLPSLSLIATSATAVLIVICAGLLPTLLGLKIWRRSGII